MELNWYKLAKNKKDISPSNGNKCIVAQKTKEGQKPFIVVIVRGDTGEEVLESLKDKPEWAFTAKGARTKFKFKYPFLRQYNKPEYNTDWEVKIDQARLQEDRNLTINNRTEEEDEQIRSKRWDLNY